jgi:hypothetical protein
MKRFLVVAALLALAAPAAFAAPPAGKGKPDSNSSSGVQSSAALCKAQRKSMGMGAFRALYAPTGSPKAAMDACLTKVSAQTTTTYKNAAKECKALRDQDPVAFKSTWGTNTNGANAFGKCVSTKAKAQTQEQQQETVSAAQACKKEKADGAQAFADKYGTGNKKNAFGKCVSATKKSSEGSGD